MNARELYRAGKLAEAVASQNEEVRRHPTDVERRSFLCELLCFAGNLERADQQLETIERMDSAAGPSLGLLRQLVRAEKTRQEVLGQGRAPELVTPPTPHVEALLQAQVALRAGDGAEVERLVAAAEEARPRAQGALDGAPFEDFRDADDLTGGVLEVLTSTGRYFWVPVEHLASLELDRPEHPVDLLWRPVAMSVRGGPDGKVFLPTTYAPTGVEPDDAARLGRSTSWLEDKGCVRGVGLRTFLVGEEARTVLELGEVVFEEQGA